MKLKLERPLAVFDLETTGVRIGQDRIVQIAIIRINPDGSRDQYSKLVNPEMPIPAESSAIHGIRDEDVANEPNLKTLAPEIVSFLKGCDLSGFNCGRFDIPLLREELFKVGHPLSVKDVRVVDAQRIYHKMEPRNLSAALKFYAGKEHETAHDALGDVEATIDVLFGQLDKYDDLPKDTDSLHEFCNVQMSPDPAGKLRYDDMGRVCIGFGKHAGKPLAELAAYDSGYLGWLLNKAELPAGTKATIKDLLESVQ